MQADRFLIVNPTAPAPLNTIKHLDKVFFCTAPFQLPSVISECSSTVSVKVFHEWFWQKITILVHVWKVIHNGNLENDQTFAPPCRLLMILQSNKRSVFMRFSKSIKVSSDNRSSHVCYNTRCWTLQLQGLFLFHYLWMHSSGEIYSGLTWPSALFFSPPVW